MQSDLIKFLQKSARDCYKADDLVVSREPSQEKPGLSVPTKPTETRQGQDKPESCSLIASSPTQKQQRSFPMMRPTDQNKLITAKISENSGVNWKRSMFNAANHPPQMKESPSSQTKQHQSSLVEFMRSNKPTPPSDRGVDRAGQDSEEPRRPRPTASGAVRDDERSAEARIPGESQLGEVECHPLQQQSLPLPHLLKAQHHPADEAPAGLFDKGARRLYPMA